MRHTTSNQHKKHMYQIFDCYLLVWFSSCNNFILFFQFFPLQQYTFFGFLLQLLVLCFSVPEGLWKKLYVVSWMKWWGGDSAFYMIFGVYFFVIQFNDTSICCLVVDYSRADHCGKAFCLFAVTSKCIFVYVYLLTSQNMCVFFIIW